MHQVGDKKTGGPETIITRELHGPKLNLFVFWKFSRICIWKSFQLRSCRRRNLKNPRLRRGEEEAHLWHLSHSSPYVQQQSKAQPLPTAWDFKLNDLVGDPTFCSQPEILLQLLSVAGCRVIVAPFSLLYNSFRLPNLCTFIVLPLPPPPPCARAMRWH